MKYIFFDTETTGLEDTSEVIQLAYAVNDGDQKVMMDKTYSSPQPISYKAMAVHNITTEMTEGQPRLDSSDSYIFV